MKSRHACGSLMLGFHPSLRGRCYRAGKNVARQRGMRLRVCMEVMRYSAEFA
jgi:hypothetical protein